LRSLFIAANTLQHPLDLKKKRRKRSMADPCMCAVSTSAALLFAFGSFRFRNVRILV
jgi:hypothetical protein